MDSLDLIKRFWTLNKESSFGSSSIALYLYLVDEWDNNKNNDFSLSDKKISNVLKVSRKTVKTSKDSLRNLGLITYTNKTGFACTYKIIENSSSIISSSSKPIKKSPSIPKTNSKHQNSVPQEPNPPQVTKHLPDETPTKEEFLAFAKTLEIYDPNHPNIDYKIETKYETWLNDGWKNGYGKPIRNWKVTLKSTFPYLLSDNQKTKIIAPSINRPKPTYNE